MWAHCPTWLSHICVGGHSVAKTEHLYRRGGIYYWRRRLPLNLSSKIGREDVARSLLTTDPGDARRLSRHLSTITDEFFEVAQSDSSLTAAAINKILQDLLRVEVEEAERSTASARPQSREKSDDYLEILRDHREAHARDLSENDLTSVHRWADDALAERGLTVDKSSQEYRELCRGILRVRIDATTEEINRREGRYPSLLQPPQVVPEATPHEHHCPDPEAGGNPRHRTPRLNRWPFREDHTRDHCSSRRRGDARPCGRASWSDQAGRAR
jgi:hypothetical protein